MEGLGTLPSAISITRDGSVLDELIYSFLLQSGYPRASIVFDIDLLGPTAQVGSGMKVPTFVIVDPHNAEPLAVIEIAPALDSEPLKQVAIETGAYASRLAGKSIQGFVIRIDPEGRTEDEQIQFFRIWPNSTLQRLSSKNFPDIEALRVSRKLTLAMTAREMESASQASGSKADTTAYGVYGKIDNSGGNLSRAGLYLPALVLLALIVADVIYNRLMAESFLSLSQSILAVGAALLLTLPSALRYLRK